MNRDLDGIYFRVKRGQRWESVCFSDLTDEEMDVVLEGHTADWLKNTCKMTMAQENSIQLLTWRLLTCCLASLKSSSCRGSRRCMRNIGRSLHWGKNGLRYVARGKSAHMKFFYLTKAGYTAQRKQRKLPCLR